MRHILFILITVTISVGAFAQDKVLKNDNTVVAGKVLRVDSTSIEIDPVGEKPFIIVPRACAKFIIYEDNSVVSFEKDNYNPYLEEYRQKMEAAKILLEEYEAQILRSERELDDLDTNTFSQQGIDRQNGSEGIHPGSESKLGYQGPSNFGGSAGMGNGISYGLGGRGVIGLVPRPGVDNCNVASRIVVTVEIQVDRGGNVVGASVKSATFADNCIWNTVLEAARGTKFTSNQKADFKQTGWIKYTIEP